MMDLRELGCEDVNRTDLVQYRVQWPAIVNTVLKLRFSRNVQNFLTS